MSAATANQRRSFSTETEHDDRASNHEQKRFFDHYEWWFVVLGLIGNALFFVGSVCFLSKAMEKIGVGLFIVGSCFMLVSSTATAMSEYSESKTK